MLDSPSNYLRLNPRFTRETLTGSLYCQASNHTPSFQSYNHANNYSLSIIMLLPTCSAFHFPGAVRTLTNKSPQYPSESGKCCYSPFMDGKMRCREVNSKSNWTIITHLPHRKLRNNPPIVITSAEQGESSVRVLPSPPFSQIAYVQMEAKGVQINKLFFFLFNIYFLLWSHFRIEENY